MVFEEAIRERQKYRGTEYLWPQMNIGDLVGAVLSIHDAEKARQFFDEYVLWLTGQPDLEEEPATVAQMNIGWCFGEGMPESDRKMWRTVTQAFHPVLPL